ncbi:MAG TPA: hypothetical protein VFJ09_09400 [Nocardioidaceae bacterium]|nr:hypothetical protein [Nocardioidaceae bacterium]
MKNPAPATAKARVLVVGRSPSVLVAAVELMRSKGYRADVTNQFDRVLDDYHPSDLDVVVFGGMVPTDTKQHLRDEITRGNPGVTIVQGLAGIPGVIAAQVDSVTRGCSTDDAEIGYDPENRAVRVTLPHAAQATIETLWMTSWRPPEPTSTSAVVFDDELAGGSHAIAIPDRIPTEGSFATVTVGTQVSVFAIGPMPTAVTRMVPKSSADTRLPAVPAITTHRDES